MNQSQLCLAQKVNWVSYHNGAHGIHKTSVEALIKLEFVPIVHDLCNSGYVYRTLA